MVCLQFYIHVWGFFLIEGFSVADDVVVLRPKKKSRGKMVIFELVP